jgi:hypothetical protein
MSWIYTHPLKVTNVLDQYYLTYLQPRDAYFENLQALLRQEPLYSPDFRNQLYAEA